MPEQVMDGKKPRVMAPQRYRRLLEVAASEFAGAGFERASLNAIIRECAISKSSFYHYFESKEALFDTVVMAAATELAGALAAPDPATLAEPDFWDRIAAFVAQAEGVLMRKAWYSDLGRLFYLADLSTERSPALQQVLMRIAEWVARALAAGRACGAVRDDLPATLQAELAFAVLRAMDRWSLRHMDEIEAGDDLVARQLDALRRLLAP
jgi:AcrR family transcriptional regulator